MPGATQTENKDHGPLGPMDGPFGTHRQHIDTQVSRHYHNKEGSVSCDDVNPFDAAATTGGKVPTIPWDPDLSSPPSAESYDPMQTFETRTSGSLPNELMDLDPDSMLGCRKETGSSPCLPLTASARPSQQTYKYDTRPAAMSVHHSPSSNGPSTSSREQNDTCPSSPYFTRTPGISDHTMSYQRSWLHQSLESCGLQAPHGRFVFPRSPHPVHEAMPSFTDTSFGEERIPTRAIQLPVRYSSNDDSHPRASSISTPSTQPLPSQTYSDHSTPGPLSASSQAQPHPILRSQHPEVLPDSSWHSAPIQSPAYQFSTAEPSTRGSPVWWAESHIPNHNMPHLSQGGYHQHINMAPIPPQAHHNTDSLHHTFQDNPMMMPMTQSPETLPVPEQTVAPSPVPSSDSLGHTQYISSGEQVYQSLPHSPYFENPNPPRAELQHHSLSVAQIDPKRRLSTGAVQRSPRTRTQTTAPHRRRNGSRKQSTSSASTGARSAKGVTKGNSTNNNNSNSNTGSSESPICVSFVNFTAKDSHKILSGVAPSGANKTKARREQEEREKHNRTLMAVRRAGGDEAVAAVEAVLY